MTEVAAGMPLQGISVLVTRPDYAAQPLVEMITTAGGRAIRQAGVDILPTTNESHRRQLCGPAAQIAIFTSRPAVRFGLSNFLACDWSQQTEILAIGPATAAEVERRGLLTTAFASQSNSESLLTLPLLQRPKGQRILIFGAPGGRTLIQRELSQRGALVDSIQVYQRQPAQLCNDALQQILHDFERLVVSVSSVAILSNLVQLLQNRLPRPIQQCPLAVTSARIAATAAQMGFTRVEIAESSADAALLQTVSLLASKMKGRPE